MRARSFSRSGSEVWAAGIRYGKVIMAGTGRFLITR